MLIAVTKISNPSFLGMATAEQIAQNPNLVVAGKVAVAEDAVKAASEKIAAKAEIDAAIAAGKPSEAVKPSDIKRRPSAPAAQ